MAEGTEGLREVSASEILDKIKKGEPIEYDRIIIKGDLDIRILNPEKSIKKFLVKAPINKRFLFSSLINTKYLVSSSIKITNSQIDGDVYFSNTIFREPLNFEKTKFIEDVRFAHALFLDCVSFNSAKFYKFAGFYRALFNGEAMFAVGTFLQSANFRDARFGKPSNFVGTNFFGSVVFSNACFSGKTDFTQSHFWENTEFWDSVFGKEAYFQFIVCEKKANFRHAVFRGIVSFFKSQFKDYSIFSETKFKRKADFESSNFCGKTLFTDTQFDNESDFFGSDFTGEYISFGGAKFNDNRYRQIDLFMMAKKSMEEIGDSDEADRNFYGEMDAKRRTKLIPLRYLELIFHQWIFGYGVHPYRLFFIWLAMVIAFGLIHFVGKMLDGSIGPTECVYFSLISAATPSSGNYHLMDELICQCAAGLGAIISTFMWAAFIATFARKFSR